MRILIVKLSSMGDLFHALPAVHNLKAELKADVDWVVQSEYVDLVRCFTDVDRVIPFRRCRILGSIGKFLRRLRQDEYDYVIDLQGLLKSAIVGRLARSKRRIGPSFHREGAALFYTSVAGARDKNRHAVEECLDVVSHLGLKRIPPEFPVRFPDVEVSQPRPRIALMPVSRWVTKNWPPACFVDTINLIRRTREVSVYLLGGPADRSACASIETALNGEVVNMAGRLNLVETGGFLSKMDLLISNDSGPVHMAAAAGTPTLVIFGPTEPTRTGPYGDQHRIVTARLTCQPCLSRTCKVGGVPCLSGVTPERVAEVALEMLREAKTERQHSGV